MLMQGREVCPDGPRISCAQAPEDEDAELPASSSSSATSPRAGRRPGAQQPQPQQPDARVLRFEAPNFIVDGASGVSAFARVSAPCLVGRMPVPATVGVPAVTPGQSISAMPASAAAAQACWRCAVDLQAIAHACGDAPTLVSFLLHRRPSAHPGTDIPALALATLKAGGSVLTRLRNIPFLPMWFLLCRLHLRYTRCSAVLQDLLCNRPADTLDM